MRAPRVRHLKVVQNSMQLLVQRLALIRVSTDAGVGHRRVHANVVGGREARVVRVNGSSVADIVGVAREGRVLLVALVRRGRVRVGERRPTRRAVGRIPCVRAWAILFHVHSTRVRVSACTRANTSVFTVFREQHTDAGVYDVPHVDTAGQRAIGVGPSLAGSCCRVAVVARVVVIVPNGCHDGRRVVAVWH